MNGYIKSSSKRKKKKEEKQKYRKEKLKLRFLPSHTLILDITIDHWWGSLYSETLSDTCHYELGGKWDDIGVNTSCYFERRQILNRGEYFIKGMIKIQDIGLPIVIQYGIWSVESIVWCICEVNISRSATRMNFFFSSV